MKEKIPQAAGWNTWNSRSVLSHVLMPEGFAVNLGLKTYRDGRILTEALVRAADGSYTELTLHFGDASLRVQSMTRDGALYLLVTPLRPVSAALLV